MWTEYWKRIIKIQNELLSTMKMRCWQTLLSVRVELKRVLKYVGIRRRYQI